MLKPRYMYTKFESNLNNTWFKFVTHLNQVWIKNNFQSRNLLSLKFNDKYKVEDHEALLLAVKNAWAA